MNGDSVDTATKLVTIGRSPDPELQNEAFRLWIENGRSTRIVAAAIGCDRRTIQRWKESERWEERRIEQAQSFLPGARSETSFALKLAAHNAAIRLQQIAFESYESGTKPDIKEVQALTMIVDRGGYSPVGSRSPVDGSDPLAGDHDRLPDFTAMTPEELRAWDERARKRARRVS